MSLSARPPSMLMAAALAVTIACTSTGEPPSEDGSVGNAPRDDSGPEDASDWPGALPLDCDYEEMELSFGEMGVQPASAHNRILISVPHGVYDRNTHLLGTALVTHLEAHLLWARGYRSSLAPLGPFVNVNRPTDFWGNETDQAWLVFDTYRACADKVPHDVYIEIHGNSASATSERMEVATTEGFDETLATRIRAEWLEVRGERFADIDLWIEPLDDIYWNAGATKAIGMMADCPELCMHFELPSGMRDEEGGVLAAAAEALALLLERTLP